MPPASVSLRTLSTPTIRRLANPLAAVLLALVLLPVLPARTRASEPPPALLEEFRQDPMLFFFQLRITEAVACGQELLADPTIEMEEKRGMLTALAAIHVAADRPGPARAACLALLEPDPTRDLDDPAALPPPVKRLFYSLRDSLLLQREIELPPDIRTVAVGEIGASALVAGRFDLERFARGLTHVIVSDLEGATPLRIVDRQRLDVLLEEIDLQEHADIVDPAYAVPFGKLSGAQSFLFGQVLQIDRDRIRLDLRWVNTSTSEVLLSEGIEMKVKSADDLFDLERKVLVEMLVPRMHAVLTGSAGLPEEVPTEKEMKNEMKRFLEERKRRLAKKDAYVEVLLRAGDAVLAEKRGDLAAARAAWAAIEELSPGDPEAASRGQALAAHLGIAQNEEAMR